MILTHGANSIGSGGGGSLIYETDFSDFDYANKIDYPKIGNPKSCAFNSSDFIKTSINIDGVEYSCIKHKTINSSSFDMDFSQELNDVNLYTFESLVYKPSWAGVGGAVSYIDGNKRCGSPIINCYRTERGYGVQRSPAEDIDNLFNDFRFVYETFYFSTQSNIRDISGICKGGVTFDTSNNIAKVYLKNKKALTTNGVRGTLFRFYGDANMELYLLGLKIIKKDLFEEME